MFGLFKGKKDRVPPMKRDDAMTASDHAFDTLAMQTMEAQSAEEHIAVGPAAADVGWQPWPSDRAMVTLVRRHMSLVAMTNGLSDPPKGQKKVDRNGIGLSPHQRET